MGSDACFRMGSTHQICQDYAIAGARQGLPYAILSDGCSGVHTPGEPGSPFTDFGSRFLVRMASVFLRKTIDGGLPLVVESDLEWLNGELTHIMGESLASEAYRIARQAGFDKRALDATLIRAVQRPDGSVVVHQAGDGVVAARNRETGLITYTTMKFGNNMPYYLSYLLDIAERRRYFDLARSVEVTTANEVAGSGMGGWNWVEETVVHPLIAEIPIFQRFIFGPEYDLVLIMSDGAESFQDQEGQIVPVGAIVKQLFDVKSFEGEFLIRRCNKFLSRFCAERGWKHTDDFSVAGIHLKGTP